jgi:hypothetical protein
MVKKPKKPKSPKHHYLVVIWGDVEPQLRGPFKSDSTRLAAARKYRRDEGDDDGLYRLDIDAKGRPQIGVFTGSELDVEES